MRRANAALLTIEGSNKLINLGGGLGSRYALIFAPLAIVQAISSTTTLFVFLFGVALSLLFPHLAAKRYRFATSCRRVPQQFWSRSAWPWSRADVPHHGGACAQNATAGPLAVLASMPHETCRSSRNVG